MLAARGADGHPQLVGDDGLVVALLGISHHHIVHQGELTEPSAELSQVALGQALLVDLTSAVLTVLELPTGDERFRVSIDRELFLIGELSGHDEPRLIARMQVVVHRVLLETIDLCLSRLDVDVSMEMFDVHLGVLRSPDQLDADTECLAVGDAPRIDVVAGRVDHADFDWRRSSCLVDDGVDAVVATFEVVVEYTDALFVLSVLRLLRPTGTTHSDQQEHDHEG